MSRMDVVVVLCFFFSAAASPPHGESVRANGEAAKSAVKEALDIPTQVFQAPSQGCTLRALQMNAEKAAIPSMEGTSFVVASDVLCFCLMSMWACVSLPVKVHLVVGQNVSCCMPLGYLFPCGVQTH